MFIVFLALGALFALLIFFAVFNTFVDWLTDAEGKRKRAYLAAGKRAYNKQQYHKFRTQREKQWRRARVQAS